MAMTESGMAAAIKTEIEAIPGISITDDAELQKFCDAIGKAVVTYIQGNAEVSSSGATGSGPPGGPLPITNLAGTIS